MEDKASHKTDGTTPIPTDNGASPMETDAKDAEPQKEVVRKRRTLKHSVPFESHHAGLSSKDVSVCDIMAPLATQLFGSNGMLRTPS